MRRRTTKHDTAYGGEVEDEPPLGVLNGSDAHAIVLAGDMELAGDSAKAASKMHKHSHVHHMTEAEVSVAHTPCSLTGRSRLPPHSRAHPWLLVTSACSGAESRPVCSRP